MSSLSRRTAFIGALVVIILFAVYAFGANRTIHVGDSGELVTAVDLQGIPHPSGYPDYTLLGLIWTRALPLGSIAFRMSLFSAVCAAAACGLLFVVCRRTGLSVIASLLAAGLAAFCPSFWAEANIQRTYSLNALFLILALLAFQRWLEERTPFRLVPVFLLCGIGASNHLFMAVCALCVAIAATVAEPALVRRPGRIVASLAAFIIGLLPYLYLPLRSRSDPPLDWGDPERAGGLLRVVLRYEYWDRAWVEGPSDLVVVTLDYLRGIGSELAWVGALLAVAAVLHQARRLRGGQLDPIVLLAVLIMAANVITLAVHGSRADLFVWHRYYIPSYLMAAVLAGVGFDALTRRIPTAARAAALLLPLYLLVSGWQEHDRSRYRMADEFSRLLMERLPPGAHLVASDDNILFPLMYLHFVEKVRPDIHLILQGVGAELPPLKLDPDAEPLFMTHHPGRVAPGVDVVASGLVFQVIRADAARTEPPALPERLSGEDDPRVPKDYLTQNLIGHYHYMLGLTHEARSWPRARDEFLLAARAAPDNDVLFYNLGLVYRRNGLLDEALEAFRRSDAINPRALASPDRPRASDRVAEMIAERERLTR